MKHDYSRFHFRPDGNSKHPNRDFELLKSRQVYAATVDQINDPFEMYEFRKNYVYRVVCFSRTLYNLLQWSHYANGHRGYCVEYNVNHHAFRRYGLIDVKYQDAVPNHQDRARNHAYVLATKPTCWSYEQETRWIVLANPDNFLLSVDGAIEAIYLGWKMSSPRVDEFVTEFKGKFPVFQMEPVEGFYALRAKEIA